MTFFNCAYKSSAKVVDGSLVLSLPDAQIPTVMRMDLEEVKAAALEVTPKKDAYVLTLKVAKGDIREIAPFEKREQAVAALMAASQALEKGSSRSGYVAVNESAQGSSGAALKWAGAIGVLVLLFWMVSGMGSGNIPRAPAPTASSGSPTGAAALNPTATGTPLSADDFLARRGQ